MIQIEDQRRRVCQVRYVSKGDVFEYEGDVYIKVDDDIHYNVTKNVNRKLDDYTEVYEVQEAVLCLN